MARSAAVDKAYSWLHERILEGRIPGGAFVDEATVCDAVGVSRTPVREAFNKLEGEGYLTLVPRRGAQVRSIGLSDVHNAFDARFLVESQAVREFCAGSRYVPDVMRTSLETMASLSLELPGDEVNQYLQADREFHTAYVATLGNPLILDFYNSIWHLIEWSSRGQLGRLRNPSYRAINDTQHRAILAALEKNSAREAIFTLREHLRPFSEVAILLDDV